MKINILLISLFFIFFAQIPCLYSQDKKSKPGPEATASAKAAPGQSEDQKEESAPPSVCEVNPSEKDPNLFTIELKNADINDLFRLLAHDYGLNILVDEAVKGAITASLTLITLEEALEVIGHMNNLLVEKKGSVLLIKPNLTTKTFYLKYINAEELIRQSKTFTSSGSNAQGEISTTEVISVGNTIYDLLSDQGKVFSGSQGNSLVVIDYPPHVARIDEYLAAIDTKLSTRVFKLQYMSVKDLFPSLSDDERTERQKQRDERKAERDEIKEIREKASDE